MNKPIFLEYHILDNNTGMPVTSYLKTFTSGHDFNQFYQLAKSDTHAILNILSYNPKEMPGQKSSFDIKLYSVSRERNN